MRGSALPVSGAGPTWVSAAEAARRTGLAESASGLLALAADRCSSNADQVVRHLSVNLAAFVDGAADAAPFVLPTVLVVDRAVTSFT